MCRYIRILCVPLLGMAVSAHASPAQNTPEELVGAVISAARRGDVPQFLACLTATSRASLTESFANRSALREAQQAFRRALDNQYGKGGILYFSPEEDLKSVIVRFVGAEILEKKRGPPGIVKLRVRTSVRTPDGRISQVEDTLGVQRERGAWKLRLGFAPQGQRVANYIGTLQRYTKSVQEGAYKDRMTAMIALDNALNGKGSVTR